MVPPLVETTRVTARAAPVSRTTTILGLAEAATAFPSNRQHTTLPTNNGLPTWTPLGHQSALLAPAWVTKHKGDTLPLVTTAVPPALTTRLFVAKEVTPVRGNVAPDTTRALAESYEKEILSMQAPALPPYEDVPRILRVANPDPQHPGFRAEKDLSSDELDRVVSMYYDRQSPVKSNNWL